MEKDLKRNRTASVERNISFFDREREVWKFSLKGEKMLLQHRYDLSFFKAWQIRLQT